MQINEENLKYLFLKSMTLYSEEFTFHFDNTFLDRLQQLEPLSLPVCSMSMFYA